jgi:hypothetical protein
MVNDAALNRFYPRNPYRIAKSSGCNNEISCDRDVTALVVPDHTLSGNLLGMSFLSRVRWPQDPGLLALEQ